MTIRTFVVYGMFAAAALALVSIAVKAWFRRGGDQTVDDLITVNTARSRDGMGKVDRDLANLAGKRRSDQVDKAQGNCRQAERLNHRIESRRGKVRAFSRGIR